MRYRPWSLVALGLVLGLGHVSAEAQQPPAYRQSHDRLYRPGLGPTHPGMPPLWADPHDHFARRPPYQYNYNPVAAILPMADHLVIQTDDFLRRFVLLADSVPERRGFINDTRSLRRSAERLSQSVRRGDSLNQIRSRVRDLDRIYQRLNNRLNRVARGRPPGPNIVAILHFGETVQAIHRQLEFGSPIEPLAPPIGRPHRPFP